MRSRLHREAPGPRRLWEGDGRADHVSAAQGVGREGWQGKAEGQQVNLLMAQAIEIVRAESKASVSLIQRRLKIGYTVATAIIDTMERTGIIGPANGSEPRAILALPDPQPTGTPAMDTSNPPPPPAKKKSDKRKPTKAEFQAQKDARSEGDK